MSNALLIDIPFRILLIIQEPLHISKIAKKTNKTYSHMSMRVHQLEDIGLLNLEKTGRKTMVSLTKKGEKVRKLFKQIKKNL